MFPFDKGLSGRIPFITRKDKQLDAAVPASGLVEARCSWSTLIIPFQISAQESRRKKKEYMDQLERKVEILAGENVDYRKRVESLEQSNNNLLSQLALLQAAVARAARKWSASGTIPAILL